MSDVERVDVPPPDPRRRAIVRLGAQQLGALIELPDGLRVVAVAPVWETDGIAIMVEGDQLEPNVEGSVLPELERSIWSRMSFVDDDGIRWVRFGWTPRASSERLVSAASVADGLCEHGAALVGKCRHCPCQHGVHPGEACSVCWP